MDKYIKNYLLNLHRESYVNDPEPLLREQGIDRQQVIDCSLGINPFGNSPSLADINNIITPAILREYPEPNAANLVQELCQTWQEIASLTPGNIVIGSGSMGILEKINKLTLERGRRVLGYCPQFTEYITEVKVSGATYEGITLSPETDFAFSTEQLISQLNSNYTLVYLDNPNNPTGQIIPLNEIEVIVRAAKEKQVMVIIDEAYGDFMDRQNSAIALVNQYDNIVVTRSFSKGFGLAGLRVGYGIMNLSLSEYYCKVNLPFPISTPAEHLAISAVKDQQFLQTCRTAIAREKNKLMKACHKLGLHIAKTDLTTPIMTLGLPEQEINLYTELLRVGIITESGLCFPNLGQNYVRLRVPKDTTPIIERIKHISTK
ncbi:MAG: pyridoxal phosphate-dependent aminotransferase [bacterium]|jgi:histidinol-phosphate aminotransferase